VASASRGSQWNHVRQGPVESTSMAVQVWGPHPARFAPMADPPIFKGLAALRRNRLGRSGPSWRWGGGGGVCCSQHHGRLGGHSHRLGGSGRAVSHHPIRLAAASLVVCGRPAR